MPFLRRRGLLLFLLLACLLTVLDGCGRLRSLDRRHVAPAQVATLDRASPWLKAHLRGGGVYVLSDWRVDGGDILGSGVLLDLNRDTVDSGEFRFAADSAALFETNVTRPTGARTAITVMVGITAAIGGICLANPKACFGSCPTFYVPDSTGAPALRAEGFSTSIAPALEATDVDMLHDVRIVDGSFTMRVTNEALETHVIRHADVLALPRGGGERVYRTGPAAFRAVRHSEPLRSCTAPEGSCLDALRTLDRSERWSAADSSDLGARELLELEFETAAGDVGVVITARQTLLTTYLIYQALAWLGSDAGRVLAALDGRDEALRDRAFSMGRTLGLIEVLVQDEHGTWIVAGTAGETGPLASDTWLVPLPHATGRVRLRMTRGLWRIDHVALATLGAEVTPVRVPPSRVTRDGVNDAAALAALLDPRQTLVTLPGDAYDITYALPPGTEDYELFLEARGYYLEWMRQEWLAEQDHAAALRMLLDPAGVLRTLAPAYKRGEADMERIFWGSRYELR